MKITKLILALSLMCVSNKSQSIDLKKHVLPVTLAVFDLCAMRIFYHQAVNFKKLFQPCTHSSCEKDEVDCNLNRTKQLKAHAQMLAGTANLTILINLLTYCVSTQK